MEITELLKKMEQADKPRVEQEKFKGVVYVFNNSKTIKGGFENE